MAGQLEYSSTAASNTAINGIGIAGSNTIKNGNDAMQQIMADTAAAVTKVVDKALGTYAAAKTDFNQLWRATGAVTINLTAAATLTAGWCMWVMADGGAVTVDPNSTEQINGAATLSLPDGYSALILCTGSAFRALVVTNGNVTLTGTQTLTNKTLTSPVINTPTTADKPAFRLAIDATGNIHKRTVMTASGTHNLDAETKLFMVEVWGGGGGGGGAPTVGASTAAAAGGGGQGGYCSKLITRGAINSGTVVIGAGGASAAAGGNSSWSDGVNTLTANGGSGGGAGLDNSVFSNVVGGSAGSASGGDVNIKGQPGQAGSAFVNGSNTFVVAGRGGGQGAGRGAVFYGSSTQQIAGETASTAPGGGGGGSATCKGGGAIAGGAGTSGLVIITEYK